MWSIPHEPMAATSIGLIETRGLVGVIEAADTAVKAADVQLLGIEQTGGGFVSVRFQGDVAAVRAAVQVASAAASKVSELITAHVIPGPHREVPRMLARGLESPSAALGSTPLKVEPAAGDDLDELTAAQLACLPVARLRQLARRTPGIALQGRQISRANKEQLLQALERARTWDDSGGSAGVQ